MKVLKTFRHEYKYVISYADMLMLRTKLNKVLNIDRSDDGYLIRSLYFDSIDDEDYYDKLGGEINRKKMRLRIYQPNADFVKLEIKAKHDVHQLKRSLVLDRSTALELIKENYDVLLKFDDETAKEAYTILRKGLYKPKVIIEYQRIAYITSTSTRITFDYDIKSSNDVECFFDEDINYNDLTYKTDVVLEVKFDRFLEPYLSNLLSSYGTRGQSVSKYVMGRNLEGGNL